MEKIIIFFISDACGDSRVVEYNYKKKNREYTVTRKSIATNFYVFDKETFGHGHGRYKTVEDIITKQKLKSDELWEALKQSSQTKDPDEPTSNTQWSILFHNTEKSADIIIRRHYEDAPKTLEI